tara:strand:+ start:831 stop:1064 length:234 start_codon:yes stop_codon:yes gene_type:complete
LINILLACFVFLIAIMKRVEHIKRTIIDFRKLSGLKLFSLRYKKLYEKNNKKNNFKKLDLSPIIKLIIKIKNNKIIT